VVVALADTAREPPRPRGGPIEWLVVVALVPEAMTRCALRL
jgi:hypothetical protein